MPNIEIIHENCTAKVLVDGVDLSAATEAQLHFKGGEVPVLQITLQPHLGRISIDEGRLAIKETLMPEAVELALLDSLLMKHKGKGAKADADLAFKAFAQREMPWLLDEPEDDTERLMRTTALIAFTRGYEAARAPSDSET